MRRLVVSLDAEHDLEEIFDYVSLDRPSAALELIAKLRDSFKLLLNHPLLGEARPSIGKDSRAFVVRPYVVYYSSNDTELLIARVLHSSRDVRALFW